MDTSTYCKGKVGVSGKPVPCCIRCLRRTDPPAADVLWLHQPRVRYAEGAWSCLDVHSEASIGSARPMAGTAVPGRMVRP